jgi:hypothetical protein
MKVVRKRLSKPLVQVIELLGVVDVAHQTLQKIDQRINCVIMDVR